MAYENYTLIRVSLPLEGHDKPHLLEEVINLLYRSQPVGVMGNYAGVYDLADNTEGFIPTTGATPTKGAVGKGEQAAARLLTTYAHETTPPETLERFLAELAHIHPWELPGISLFPIKMWIN